MTDKNSSADLVLFSTSIFTGISGDTFSGAIAIKGNRLVEVGTAEKVRDMIGKNTKVLELGDKTILPGFQDFHTHLYIGSCLQGKIDLSSATSEEAAAKMIGEYAAGHPDEDWIIGYGWYHIFWEEIALPKASSIDKYVPDRPVLLFNSEFHGCWINSEAMRRCGITDETENPPYGELERDENGSVTGFLYETAMKYVVPYALSFSEETNIKMYKKMEERALTNGITSINDMLPLPGAELDNVEIYKKLEDQGKLKIRIFFEKSLSEDTASAEEARRKYSKGKVRFSGLKTFVDGVATTYTAFLLEPYADRLDTKGNTLLPPEVLEDWVVRADHNNFRVRLHACGNAAVKLALDCYEKARKRNGNHGLKHAIEHIEYIDPADVQRFKELGVIASIQPEHLAITDKFADNPYPVRHGVDCESKMFLNKTFLDAGVMTAYASDYPIVDMKPLVHIYRAVTRRFNDGLPPDGWNSKERVSLSEAIKCYTSGSAYGNSVEEEIGTLESGKLADIAILDRDIFNIPIEELKETSVFITISDGEIVYKLES